MFDVFCLLNKLPVEQKVIVIGEAIRRFNEEEPQVYDEVFDTLIDVVKYGIEKEMEEKELEKQIDDWQEIAAGGR